MSSPPVLFHRKTRHRHLREHGLAAIRDQVPLRELITKAVQVAAKRSYLLCRESIGQLERLTARLKSDCRLERKPSLFLAHHQPEIPELREEFVSTKWRDAGEKFRRLFTDVQLESRCVWVGTFCTTKRRLAYIGVYPRFLHAYFALGYGGNIFSLIAAEIIRKSFLIQTNSHAHLFRFGC